MPFMLGIALFIIGLFVFAGIRVIKEFERGVILRLGKYQAPPRAPGLTWIIPGIDKMYLVDLRTVARDVPPQDVITRDNVSVKVNAVLYFRVVAPDKAILNVENYLYATSQYAQTSLRSILGQAELDQLLSDRERINQDLQEVIDRHTDPWGVKVTSVELKHVDLPQEMQRAMAKQAEAERERRAKIIAAEGEAQASEKLGEAATVISRAPGAMTLRYLQTLAEIAVENNSTTVFPIPISMLEGLERYTDLLKQTRLDGSSPLAPSTTIASAKPARPAATARSPQARPSQPAPSAGGAGPADRTVPMPAVEPGSSES